MERALLGETKKTGVHFSLRCVDEGVLMNRQFVFMRKPGGKPSEASVRLAQGGVWGWIQSIWAA